MGRILTVFFLVLACGFLYFTYGQKPGDSVLSPLPKVYGAETKADTNDWFPKGTISLSKQSLNVSAKSAILVDYDTGNVIFAKDPKVQLPAASTIKIMTALLALREKKMNDVFTVSEKAANVGEDSMGVSQGEKLTLRELLYGMMLASGNDAAITLAEGVWGSEDAFVSKMNKEALDLGMHDTKFINASGLDVDGQVQYTTAFDMATLAHYVWEKYPDLRQITQTDHMFLDETASHKAFDLYNETNLLTTYPGVKGIKPGFTWDAGWCLVTYAENDGRRLIGVILGSGDRRGEMKELLDLGFGYYGIKVSHPGLDLQAN